MIAKSSNGHQKLKAYRKLYNLNQQDIAKMLEISTARYCDKENGHVEFTLSEAKKIADRFNKTIDEIFFSNDVHI